MINFTPLYERIVVEPIDSEEKTSGGIIIPDTAKDKPSKGKVIAVGEGYRLEDGSLSQLKIKVDDIILYGKWGGTEVKVDGRDVTVMKESDIIGIFS